jgi:hypothetical protein
MAGPFIVAAGGISNIFLCKLAQNIQDKYGEAAIFAEQVYLTCLCTNKKVKHVYLFIDNVSCKLSMLGF